ncbi:MAG: hypothetical protein U0X73_06525 [Thermoanaerobaculia bacterium]
MVGSKVVAHFLDGRLEKGFTSDFLPARDSFHIEIEVPGGSPRTLAVAHGTLKAVFFVKDFQGDPGHRKRNDFDPAKPVPGRKIRVEFKDGEVMVGTTQGYQPGRPGFFIVPADPEANTIRCYVLVAATRSIGWI